MKTPVKAHSETWWWWQHHVVGMLGIWSEMYGAKYRAIREGNMLQSARYLRLRQRFSFQQYNNPKYTAKPHWNGSKP